MSTYLCPHCEKSLKGRLLRTRAAPDQRRFLPLKGILVCPYRGGELHPNPQPAQAKLLFAAIPAFILGTLGPRALPDSRWFALGWAAAMLILGVATLFIQIRYLRNWPAFSAIPKRPWQR